MQRILRSSPAVSARSPRARDNKSIAIAAVVAERLGTQPDALPVRLIVGAWQLIATSGWNVRTACSTRTTPWRRPRPPQRAHLDIRRVRSHLLAARGSPEPGDFTNRFRSSTDPKL